MSYTVFQNKQTTRWDVIGPKFKIVASYIHRQQAEADSHHRNSASLSNPSGRIR